MRLVDADTLLERLGIFNGGDEHFLNGIETAREVIRNAPTAEHPTAFHVVNKRTGKRPNLWLTARRCKWAQHLCYCDMEGFAIQEDGTLILTDECGNAAYPPHGKYKVVWGEEE